MSKIPIITERATPEAAPYMPQQVQVADTSQVLKTQNQLGGALEKAGEAVLNVNDHRNKFDYSVARSRFLQDSVRLENELENSPDVDKDGKPIDLLQKYREGMTKIKENTSQALADNRYAPLLQEQINLYEQKKAGSMMELMNKKESAQNLATADKIIDESLNAFIQSKDPATKDLIISSSISTYADSIPDNDPKKPLLLQEVGKKIGKRFVEADLLQKSPLEQIRLLEEENKTNGSNITKYLPADERLEQLQKSKIAYKNQLEQDRILREKADKQATQNIDNILAQSLAEDKSWEELPMNIRLKVTPQKAAEYGEYRTQLIASGQATPSVKEAKYFEIRDTYTKDPDKFINMSSLELAGSVPSNKINEVLGWQEKARNGALAPANMTQQNSIANATTNSVGIKKGSKPYIDFNKSFSTEISAFKEEKGRDPNKSELEKLAHSLVVEATFERTFLPDIKKKLYQVDQEDLKDIVVPDADYKEIAKAAKSSLAKSGQNRNPTDKEIKDQYLIRIKN